MGTSIQALSLVFTLGGTGGTGGPASLHQLTYGGGPADLSVSKVHSVRPLMMAMEGENRPTQEKYSRNNCLAAIIAA